MAGFFSRVFGRAETRSSGSASGGGLVPALGSMASASGMPVSQATAMTVSAVYASARILSADVARCKPSLYRTADDGSRKTIKPMDHPVARLLRRPNRVQTWHEFARDLVVSYVLRGNAYAVILRDGKGDPTELIWMNPDGVTVLEASDGQVFYQTSRMGMFQMAMLAKYPLAIPAEDVLHLRGMSFNMLVGVSPIGLARDSIGLAIGQSQQQSRWVGNGARPSVILESDKTLNAESAARLKAGWESFSAGVQNVGRTAVLENGVKAKALQLTSVDLQFIDQVNLTVQDIARFFGVPTRKLMQPDSTRGSTIIQEEQAYVNSTVSPLLDMIEQKFDQVFDLAGEGLELDLNEDALLRADPLTRYNLGRIGKLSGLISTNEFRRAERLPAVPGGDLLMQPVNMAALGSDMSGQAPDGAGRPKDGHGPVSAGLGAADDAAPEG
jgi:HK97 family phage portal protein